MDNYSRYSKVLGNQVWSFMNFIRDHMISNGIIQHGMKPDSSILEVVYRLEEIYPLLQMFWAEKSLGNCYL